MQLSFIVLKYVVAGACSEWRDPVWASSRWNKEYDSSYDSEVQLSIKLACGKKVHHTFVAANVFIAEGWDNFKTDLSLILKILNYIVSKVEVTQCQMRWENDYELWEGKMKLWPVSCHSPGETEKYLYQNSRQLRRDANWVHSKCQVQVTVTPPCLVQIFRRCKVVNWIELIKNCI